MVALFPFGCGGRAMGLSRVIWTSGAWGLGVWTGTVMALPLERDDPTARCLAWLLDGRWLGNEDPRRRPKDPWSDWLVLYHQIDSVLMANAELTKIKFPLRKLSYKNL